MSCSGLNRTLHRSKARQTDNAKDRSLEVGLMDYLPEFLKNTGLISDDFVKAIQP